MAHKKKGRRVYTYRSKNHRVFSQYHPMRSAVGSVLTLLAAAFLGLVGYNIIGPIVTRMEAEKVSPTTTPDPYFETPQQTELIAEQTVPVLTAVTTSLTTMTETTVMTTTTTEPLPLRFPAGVNVSCALPESALTDLSALDRAVEAAAKEGFTGILLPLKQTGGKLLYASANEKAQTCGASAENALTLREISNAASRSKLTCSAVFSTLNDHVYPGYFTDGSYTFPDGTTRWLDDKESEGGKAWLNPFAEGARIYLSALAGEMQSAGFERIICTDVVFPHFYNSDLEILGAQVADPARRSGAIVQVMNDIAAAAPSACCKYDLSEIVNGKSEGFDPQALQTAFVCFQINLHAFTQPFYANNERYDPTSLSESDRIGMIAQVAKKLAGNMQMIPLIDRTDLEDDQLDLVVKAFADAGASAVYVMETQASGETAESAASDQT